MTHQEPLSILFVCLGNICRSPTAEAILRHKLEQHDLAHLVSVDSAGTGSWHVGAPPDPRAREAARGRGYDLSALRGRQVGAADCGRHDYLLAMDADNLAELRRLCPASGSGAAPRLFLEFAPAAGVREVPDPYHGGARGFERVLDLLEEAAEGLLADVRARLEAAEGAGSAGSAGRSSRSGG